MKHTIPEQVSWTCDRCGAVLHQKPFTLTMCWASDGVFGGGSQDRHACKGCQGEIVDAIQSAFRKEDA